MGSSNNAPKLNNRNKKRKRIFTWKTLMKVSDKTKNEIKTKQPCVDWN